MNDLLTNREATEYLKVGQSTLAVWRNTKRVEIPYAKVGKKILYRRSDLDQFLNANTVRPVEHVTR